MLLRPKGQIHNEIRGNDIHLGTRADFSQLQFLQLVYDFIHSSLQNCFNSYTLEFFLA